MRLAGHLIITLLCTLITASISKAQLSNIAFEDRVGPLPQADSGQIGIRLSTLGFTKNNEYFNKITDGYTLFGYHLLPTLYYQPAPNFRIDAGAFLHKDFGTKGYYEIQPVFTFRYQHGHHQLLFGTLEGNVSHRLVEPLQDFESVMLRRLEHGIQWRYADNSHWWVDAWIDWLKMIYPYSPFKEEVRGGLSCFYSVVQQPQHHLQLVAQFTAYHKGGQIDTLRAVPLITDVHFAPGLKYSYTIHGLKLIDGITAECYAVGYSDRSFDKIRTYKNGYGLYPNLTIHMPITDVMFSYWHGHNYVNNFGGRLYPTLSNNLWNPGYEDNPRQLLIIRFMKDFKLFSDCFLSTRFEPFFDLKTGSFEFSHGLYFNFRKSIGITKIN